MKRILLFCSLVLSIIQSNAQTYVSGGIYSNTNWTKAASPYIVTDHVVVFPGVTLKIEPGVTVKFDSSKYLEIRHAKIIAEGLSSDPIMFTSNAAIPKPKSWYGVKITNNVIDTLKFSFCNFNYASFGLSKADSAYFIGKLIVKNCNFSDIGYSGLSSNGICLLDSSKFRNCDIGAECNNGDFFINHCQFTKCKIAHKGGGSFSKSYTKNCILDSNITAFEKYGGVVDSTIVTNNEQGVYNEFGHIIIKNCTISNNSIYGVYSGYGDSILNCIISNNGIGLATGMSYVYRNQITNNKKGIFIIRYNYQTTKMFIVCNKICNNLDYEISSEPLIVTTLNYPNNYWCTPDSASTRLGILDGYKDVSLPIINFMPLDSNCYKTLGIKENNTAVQNKIKLYPNPFTHTTTLEFDNPLGRSHNLSVFNSMGQLVMSIDNIKNNKIIIDRKELQGGIYFYRLRDDERLVGTGKMMIE